VAEVVGPSTDPAALLAHPDVEVLVDEPLARHTTLRVGGPARALVTVDTEAALEHVAKVAAELGMPWFVLGRGSNLLVADEGWPGVAVRLGRGLRAIRIDGSRVLCGGAAPLPTVALQTAEAGLAGFAWGCAVPGSIGGGVRMNAGAHGADMSDAVLEARVFDAATRTFTVWSAERLAFAYRSSALPSTAVVTSVVLELQPGQPDALLAEIDRIRDWRRAHQPLNRPSCGSVFTNPPGASAGGLIEAAGLKGARIGGAEVSDLHANFIVTDPGATATDVWQLIHHVRVEVARHSGIELRPEVVRLPDPGTAAERVP
jgi:UDP-N-acetylmuramate dehydrogenase